MLEDRQVSLHDFLRTMLCKHCFQEHHHQLMQRHDLSPVIHGNDIDVVNGVSPQLDNSFTQQMVTLFIDT